MCAAAGSARAPRCRCSGVRPQARRSRRTDGYAAGFVARGATMSHRSRLAGFIIDCQDGDLDASAGFWGAALGMRVADPDSGGTGRYAEFGDTPGGLHIEVQKVEHPSRIHLDIETDDVEAEVKRLEGLGATRLAFGNARWWV